MRSTHSQNNSGGGACAACTRRSALNTTGEVLQSRMEKKKTKLAGFVGVKSRRGVVMKIKMQRVSQRGEPSERAQQEDGLLVSAVNRR